MRKNYNDFIKRVQEIQISSMNNDYVEKFDVALRHSGVFIWVIVRKSRATSSYFYDVAKEEHSQEKLDEIIFKLNEFINKRNNTL